MKDLNGKVAIKKSVSPVDYILSPKTPSGDVLSEINWCLECNASQICVSSIFSISLTSLYQTKS